MANAKLKALFDSDVLLDFLDGFSPAAAELARYRERNTSIISWMELLAGAKGKTDEETRRDFLNHFNVLPLTMEVAEEAVAVRREHRVKPPDAIIWATAIVHGCLLISRNTKDFPSDDAGVRFPYRR